MERTARCRSPGRPGTRPVERLPAPRRAARASRGDGAQGGRRRSATRCATRWSATSCRSRGGSSATSWPARRTCCARSSASTAGADVSLFTKILQGRSRHRAARSGDDRSAVEARPRQVEARTRRLFGRALAIRRGRRRIVQRLRAGDQRPDQPGATTASGSASTSSRRPRHADLLLVTGPVTRNMEVPLRKTYEATPGPEARGGGRRLRPDVRRLRGSYAVAGSVDQIIPVDAFVAGCPPEPADILRGILAALDRLPARSAPAIGMSLDASALPRHGARPRRRGRRGAGRAERPEAHAASPTAGRDRGRQRRARAGAGRARSGNAASASSCRSCSRWRAA